MLNLNETLRDRLLATGALVVDEDGDEVLAGLTVAESKFFLFYEIDPRDGYASAETNLYFELRHKHLVARCERLHLSLAPPDLPGE